MSVAGDVLRPADAALLARMHVEALPESLVSRVGEPYARAFYRYAAASGDELVLLDRVGQGGEVRAACVVSLAPGTLSRRLLYRTPLALHAPLALGRLPLRAVMAGLRPRAAGAEPHEAQPPGPEILLLFTVQAARGQGLGAGLLRRCEALLAARGDRRLLVKTRDDPANRAIRFYERAGFARVASVSRHGKRLVLFQKAIG